MISGLRRRSPGLPRVHEDRDEVTSKVARRPREFFYKTVFWWPAPPGGGTARAPGGSRVAGRGHEGQAGFRHGDTGACRPGNTGVKPGYSLVTEHRGYARAVRGYTEVIMPGKNQAHARVTPEEHPCPGRNRPSPRVEPGRVLGVRRADPKQNQGVTQA